MCECEYDAVCAHHAQMIVDLAERLREAEAAGEFGIARSLRGELRSYGRSVDILRRLGVLDA